MMHMDHRRRLIAIIQRCIWAPLAVIEYLGQSKEISERLGESKDKCEPIFMAIREYAINVRVIIP